MLDAHQVAPCVPGAQMTEVVDETHDRGTMRVKPGAMRMNYRGELAVDVDDPGLTMTLRARMSCS